MDDDKPAPLHCNGGQTACGIGTVDVATDIKQVTCPKCLAWIERRREAVAPGAVDRTADGDWGSAVKWPIEYGIQKAPKPSDEDVDALRRDLVEALTPEMGPKMARAAVLGPFEDPVKPAPHPAPWRWENQFGNHGYGLLLDANGEILIEDTDDVDTIDPRVRALVAAAPETAALLRRSCELVNWLSPFAFAYAAEHPESNMPTKIEVDDAYRAAMALLTRIDEAAR